MLPACVSLVPALHMFPVSVRRLAASTASKSSEDLSMEASSFSTAALLTLAGVGLIVLNQWGSSFTANDFLLRGVASKANTNCSVAEAVRLSFG